MLNRAYLYSNNSIEDGFREGFEPPYYDSRWTIPLAWFFLFLPEDMRHQERKFRGDSWQELFFATAKERAIQNFTYRIHLLQILVDNRLTIDQIETFINTVADWHGEFIILDPEEIFAGYQPKEGNESACKRILHTLANIRASITAMKSAVKVYVDLADIDDTHLEGDVLGYSYTYW